MDAESKRLEEARQGTRDWRKWGSYLTEREWGCVREDYSANGEPWLYLTHDMARSYAYRWGEDGIAGWSDDEQRLCFALAFWNGQDAILKERLFGLTNSEGNHGEDVKECSWYQDAIPSNAYMKYLYRYPQAAFPYERLRRENAGRGRAEAEYELLDTGIFNENRYFDITIEYAKAFPEDICIRVTIYNAAPESAQLHLLPTLWFRNDWSWRPDTVRPTIVKCGSDVVRASHRELGSMWCRVNGEATWMFTENETNTERLYGVPNAQPYVKDAFHRRVIDGDADAVANASGTKCAAWMRMEIPPGGMKTLHARLRASAEPAVVDGPGFHAIFEQRAAEAGAFHQSLSHENMDAEDERVARAALAGILWSRQAYHFDCERWIAGDATMPPPAPQRAAIRNQDWRCLRNHDIICVPDKWEFPWYCAWDLPFHAIPLAHVDLDDAKRQITLFLTDRYLHPSGQLPVSEWDFSQLAPPIHAWAVWRIFLMERERNGAGDRIFLESAFHKLLLNFAWWANLKDAEGFGLLDGGALGMDSLGAFDRQAPAPLGGGLMQSDAMSWMARYCVSMLRVAWELARENPVYEGVACTFLDHFFHITHSMHRIRGTADSIWDEEDGFYYDQLVHPDGSREPLRVRGMTGWLPLLAVEVFEERDLAHMPAFTARLHELRERYADILPEMSCAFNETGDGYALLASPSEKRLRRVLAILLDKEEFLSPCGIRSLSRHHLDRPYIFEGPPYLGVVNYQPGESRSNLFGGNSNWRGPVWFPLNFLLIEALRAYHAHYGDDFQVECPTGSGKMRTLWQVANEIASRLLQPFRLYEGMRHVFGSAEAIHNQPAWRDLLTFPEYLHGDSGRGLGASHQGWTALASLLVLEGFRE